MQEDSQKLDKLLEQLENLQKRQEMFSREIFHLRSEVARLKSAESKNTAKAPVVETASEVRNDLPEGHQKLMENVQVESPSRGYTESSTAPDEEEELQENFSLEKFIGENLINKIGIAITVIGVSIGVKYTIDHDLISPLMRIVLGYLAGFILLGLGIRLKTAYKNYSAVLVSGSMATLYFITYAAFTFYALIPQLTAFVLMVAITVATVYAALQYDRQIIAHFGLVGAYAIPFILSSDPGQAAILFSYTAIINIGILAISLKKYWEPLYVLSFILTWLIYFTWFNSAQSVGHFGLAFLFNAIFFVLFYVTYLAYKVENREKFDIPDIVLLLANSSIFYGVGYSLLKNEPDMEWFLGTFTIINASVHFLVMLLIVYRKISDRNLFYFVQGLALVFVTIAIPVQFKGNWITLLWACEAAMLFWIGRVRNGLVYEILSYPMMILLFISLLQNWAVGYFDHDSALQFKPLLNEFFVASMFSAASFGFIYLIDRDENYPSGIREREDITSMVSVLVPAILLFLLFFSFRNEIASYFNQYHKEQDEYKSIWLINYSLFFFSLLAAVNIHNLKNQVLGYVNLVFNVIVLFSYLTVGLLMMGMLRKHFLTDTTNMGSHPGEFCIWIRYISLVFLVLLLYYTRELSRQEFLQRDLSMYYDILLHLSAVWILSSELVNWMTIAGSTQSFKLGMSILWGTYALFVVVLGIWKKKKHLRIGAIVLFGATLLKLFFYDLSDLDTISKTILFVSLGTLLLIISFLYNKYTRMIDD